MLVSSVFHYGTMWHPLCLKFRRPPLEEIPDETFVETGWFNLVPRPRSRCGSARSQADFLLWRAAAPHMFTGQPLPEVDFERGGLICNLP